MEPVDFEAFVKDKEVQEIIEKGAGTVNITLDTFDFEPDLKAGNRKITGLDPGKYYMVEEWDENGAAVGAGVQFVGANGELSARLANIGMASGKEITGLTNRHHYRIRSAGPVPTGGEVTVPVPADGSYIPYTFAPPPSLSYDVAEVPVTPAGLAMPARRTPNGDIITLIGGEMVIDFVFLGSLSGEIILDEFYVLRITTELGPVGPGEGEIVINVTLSYTGDNPPQVGAVASYPQSDDSTLTITVTNASQYDNSATTGITWYVDGTQKDTGLSFILDKSLIEYKLVGTYTITVEAAKGGVPYSTIIEVTVTP